VFVADSSPDQREANRASWHNLTANLKAFALDKIPIVLQYNKRDLDTALPLEIMDRYLNTIRVPRFEAVAAKGIGVFDTLKAISKLVIAKL